MRDAILETVANSDRTPSDLTHALFHRYDLESHAYYSVYIHWCPS
jgi:hypothetical protein